MTGDELVAALGEATAKAMKSHKPSYKEPRVSTSKAMLFGAMLTYFVIVAAGIVCIIHLLNSGAFIEASAVLGTVTGFASAVVIVAIRHYSKKAQVENVLKIALSLEGDDVEDAVKILTAISAISAD